MELEAVIPFSPSLGSFGLAVVFLTIVVYTIRLAIPHAISLWLLLRRILFDHIDQSTNALPGFGFGDETPTRTSLCGDRVTMDEEKRLIEMTG